MTTTVRLMSVACALALLLAACGDDDGADTATDQGVTETTASADEAVDESTEPAEDAEAHDDSDGESDDAMADDGSDADDMIGAIMTEIGLSGDVLDSGERSCMNGELASSVGSLPSDLSFSNIELWDKVNAAAEACGANIGL